MSTAIFNPFFFSSLGTVKALNITDKTAAIEMEDKSGFCLVRYQQSADLHIGDILDLGTRISTDPDIFNQSQQKKITLHVLRTNMAAYQLKRYFKN